MKILFTILLLVFCFYPPIDGRFEYEYCIGLLFFSLILSMKLYEKIHWSVAVAVAILLGSGIHYLYFPNSYPIMIDQLAMARRDRSEVFFSLVSIVLISSALLFESIQFFRNILGILFFSAIVDSFVLIFNHYILGQNIPFAMLNNGTADSTFIACLLPIALECTIIKDKEDAYIDVYISGVFMILIMMFAILLCRSNTAMACLFIGYSSWLLTKVSFKSWIVNSTAVMVAIGISAYFILGHHFMGNSGRYDAWLLAWNAFIEYANPLIGFGTGTFTSWGDAFQRVPHIQDPGRYAVWYWLHNEPLQILFENGIIGVISAFIVYGFILVKSFKKKEIVFPIACVYGVISLTEMPLRLFVTQVLGLCLISIAFTGEYKNPKPS